MKKYFIWVLLLGILNSLIIINHHLGVNVILFTVPFLIFLCMYLGKNDIVKNKKGFLWLIPILVLSGSYFIFNNIFNVLNVIAIPLCYVCFLVDTIHPVGEFSHQLKNMTRILFKPFIMIGEYCNDLGDWILSIFSGNEEKKKKTKAFFIVVPIVIVVLLLLSSADMIFGNLFHQVFQVFDHITWFQVISKVTCCVLFFVYLGIVIYYGASRFGEEKDNQEKKKRDPYTMKVLLTVLNIIYIVFDVIQVNSLLLHRVSKGFNYAEYARSGFFQLMVISFINILIILLSKKSKENKYNKAMSVLMVLLTIVIIASSFFRMFLYEQAYGYTELRLFVYLILITEVLLMIPTIIYILKDKMNVVRFYKLIPITVYTIVNLVSIDKVITWNNVERYKRVGKLDVEYLANGHYDNIPELVKLVPKLEKPEEKEFLESYLKTMKKRAKERDIFEYSISIEEAKKSLKEKR